MLVDMLYNLLFNKHTFREHKRDNDRYFAVLTMVNMIMRSMVNSGYAHVEWWSMEGYAHVQ